MKSFKLIYLFAAAIVIAVGCSPSEPASINFVETSASGLESTGVFPISISLDKSIASEIQIAYTVSGTATSGQDFDVPLSPITVAAGETSVTLNLTIYDDYDYTGEDKTVIITIDGITGSGVDDASFGNNRTFTYTIQDNDMEVELTWTPASGVAEDHDLDLYIYRSDDLTFSYKSSTSFTDIVESIVMDQDDNNDTYYAVARHYSGDLTSNSVTYTITLKFPDGSTVSNSDVFDANNQSNRTLYEVVKNADGNFSASTDPFGPDGIQFAGIPEKQ